MNRLREIKSIVYEMLKEHEDTRNCDEFLYYLVCRKVLWVQGKPISNMLFTSAMLFRKELGLPKFESVRRARQKLQAEFPDLAPAKRVAKKRAEQEKVYKEFAING